MSATLTASELRPGHRMLNERTGDMMTVAHVRHVEISGDDCPPVTMLVVVPVDTTAQRPWPALRWSDPVHVEKP